MPLYATPAQARADAASLGAATLLGTAPVLILSHVEAVVQDLRSNSDTLQIVADALREAASPFDASPTGTTLRTLANTVAALAPARANPIGEATA